MRFLSLLLLPSAVPHGKPAEGVDTFPGVKRERLPGADGQLRY